MSNDQAENKKSQTKNVPPYVRSFTLSDKTTYYGPNINTEEKIDFTTQKENVVPAFMDSEGNCYDKNYKLIKNYRTPIKKTIQKSKSQDLSVENLNTKGSTSNPKNLPPFPRIDDFESFSDYEQAVLDWKTETEKSLGCLQLPTVVSRTLNRPLVLPEGESNLNYGQDEIFPKSFSEMESWKKSDKLNSPLISQNPKTNEKKKNSNQSRSGSNEQKHFDREKMQIMEDTNCIMIIDHHSWDNQLLPKEPKAIYYDTFEEFEEAYKMWSIIVTKGLKTIPPNSKDFSQIYNLRTVKEKKEKERRRHEREQALLWKEEIKKSKEKKIQAETNFYYRWINKLSQNTSTFSVPNGTKAVDMLLLSTDKKTLQQTRNEEKREKERLENIRIEEELRQKLETHQLNQETEMILQQSMTQEDKEELALLSNMLKSENFQLLGQWKHLDRDVQSRILNSTQKLKHFETQNTINYKRNSQPPFGILHGTFPNSDYNQKKQSNKDISIKFSNESSNNSENGGGNGNNNNNNSHILSNNLYNFCYRDSNLGHEIITKNLDSLKEINGKKVNFEIPEYDLSCRLELKRLKNDKPYIKESKIKLNVIQRKDEIKKISSWYWPGKVSHKVAKKDREFIDNLLQQSTKFSINDLKQIIRGRMQMDQFTHLLSDYVIFDNKELPYMQAFLSCVNADNFHNLLSLYKDSCSYLIHAKLSQFISEALQSHLSKQILEKYVHDQEVEYLYYLSYAMNFFEEIPQQLLSYLPNLNNKFSSIAFVSDSKPLENSIFTHYYLSRIDHYMQREDQMFLFVSVTSLIQEMLKNLKSSFGVICQSNPSFLEKDIYKAINCRSSTISGYYLTILIYLIRINDDVLFSLLKSPKTNLIENIKKMSFSKFSHVRFASQYLWETLISLPRWVDHLVQYYINDFEKLIVNLLPPNLEENKKKEENGKTTTKALDNDIITKIDEKKPTLISILMYRFLKNYFNNLNRLQVTSLLDERLFLNLLEKLEKYSQKQNLNESFILISDILTSMVQAFSRVNLIGVDENTESKVSIIAISRKRKLNINYGFCSRIMDIISNAPKEQNLMKAHLVKMLADIIRHQQVFKIILQNDEFFGRLNTVARNSKDMNLSREIWELFYESIFYHNGTINQLKKKYLKSLIELINPISHETIIIYGLNAMHKLFDMDNRSKRRALKGKEPNRTGKNYLRTIEKDIKSFVEFFCSSALFVKLNMIFRSYSKEASGMIFVNLAKVYEKIINSPNCQKIYKENIKKREYKEGLDIMENYIFGFQEKNEKNKKDRKWKSSPIAKKKIDINIKSLSNKNNKQTKKEKRFSRFRVGGKN